MVAPVIMTIVVVVVAPAPVHQVAPAAARCNYRIFCSSFLGRSVVCTGKHSASHHDVEDR